LFNYFLHYCIFETYSLCCDHPAYFHSNILLNDSKVSAYTIRYSFTLSYADHLVSKTHYNLTSLLILVVCAQDLQLIY